MTTQEETMPTTTDLDTEAREARVLRWRFEQQDPQMDRDLAAELAARAAELAQPALPEGERPYGYEGALDTVTRGTFTMIPVERQERLARRVHTHGKGTWHSHWVLFGSDGRGCHCGPCQKGHR